MYDALLFRTVILLVIDTPLQTEQALFIKSLRKDPAMQSINLTKADSKVLAQVFDPESGPAKAEVSIDPYLPADRHIHSTDLLQELKAREKAAIQLIEAFEKSTGKTPQAKIEAFSKALQILDALITECPQYASARNNRAQLRRWRFGDRNLMVQKRASVDSERGDAATAAVADLQECIELASPSSPQDAVSPSQGRLLAQAHTQLGALYHAAAKDLQDVPEVEVFSASAIPDRSRDAFEEEASRMFYMGGLYGNEVAKALAVHTNPHAKLCGSIVKEAMRKETAVL